VGNCQRTRVWLFFNTRFWSRLPYYHPVLFTVCKRRRGWGCGGGGGRSVRAREKE